MYHFPVQAHFVQPAHQLPELAAAPDPPSQPVHIHLGTGKLNREALVRTFVVVETKIHDLAHNLRMARQENQILCNELAQTNIQIEAMMRSFDAKLAAVKAEQSQQAKRLEEQKPASETDEGEDSSIRKPVRARYA